MERAQSAAAERVLSWPAQEQSEAEQQYRQVASRVAEIANDFVRKLAESRVPELSGIPHALARATSATYLSGEAGCATCISCSKRKWDRARRDWQGEFGHLWRCAGVLRPSAGSERDAGAVGRAAARRGSQSQLEAGIRKLLREITRVASVAPEHAREAKACGTAVVEGKLRELTAAEGEIQVLLRG